MKIVVSHVFDFNIRLLKQQKLCPDIIILVILVKW